VRKLKVLCANSGRVISGIARKFTRSGRKNFSNLILKEGWVLDASGTLMFPCWQNKYRGFTPNLIPS